MKAFAASLVTLLALATTPALAQHEHDHGHAGDIVVGITGDSALTPGTPGTADTADTADTLAFEGDFDEPILLNPVAGLLHGWTSTNPGFSALDFDEDDEFFYTLAPGAQVRLEIVSVDAGFAVYESGFAALADAPGESILLGGHELHAHPTWHASADILGPDWAGTFTATFRLVDAGSTGYGDSAPFTLTFTSIPEPASVALLSLGSIALLHRRRARI